jgi:hypothetical protein
MPFSIIQGYTPLGLVHNSVLVLVIAGIIQQLLLIKLIVRPAGPATEAITAPHHDFLVCGADGLRGVSVRLDDFHWLLDVVVVLQLLLLQLLLLLLLLVGVLGLLLKLKVVCVAMSDGFTRGFLSLA